MPNEEQWKELKDCCTWTATAWKGRKGYKVTGPNGSTIFLPATGRIWETEGKEIGTTGHYWFSTSISNTYNMFYFEPFGVSLVSNVGAEKVMLNLEK